MTLAAVLISGMLQTAKPDQSTEAAARRGRKEKKRTVYASKNKKNAPPPETVPEADWNRKIGNCETSSQS